MHSVTQLLEAAAGGDQQAAADLLPLVYGELRKLAMARMSAESPGQTLQATALVHEAYLRLVGPLAPGDSPGANFDSRGHFFAAAAEAMRRILVDHARRKKSDRRGGSRIRVQLNEDALPLEANLADSDRILAVHEALTSLEVESPRKAQLVKLRFFVGMTFEEAAKALGVAVPTVKRDWAAARVWLYRWLKDK